MRIKRGEVVAWRSQSNGVTREKTGKVMRFIPAMVESRQFISKRVAARKIHGQNASQHDRYLVQVNDDFYLPRASVLEKQNVEC